jgi:GR25 family glycosyltransferase involved in LPS biosynthesis
MKIDVCYIIHNPAHTDRDEYVADVVKCLQRVSPDIRVQYIWERPGSDLPVDLLTRFKMEGRSESHFRNACSLVMHHMKCLELFRASDANDANVALVLEDDVFVNSEECLRDTLNRLDSLASFDTVFFGDGCQPDMYGNAAPSFILTPWSRCTEAMLYSRDGAKKVLDYFYKQLVQKTCYPMLDLFLNQAYKEMVGYANYHAHPVPMSQGTCKKGLQSRVT